MAEPPPTSDPRGRPAWHAMPADEAVAAIDSHGGDGLAEEEARARRARFGPNALPAPARRSLLAVAAAQLKSPLIYLLLVAAAVALALGHRSDALVIGAVVLLNALIGALQEGRAERSMDALRRLARHRARVVRGGRDAVIEARDVVPGDVLVLEAGDAVAADARLIGGAALQIAEAALTGESVPVAKDLLPLAPDTLLADRRNMIYAGTHVTAGRARAVVVATGTATEIGHIAALAGAAQDPPTPLERRIAQFGRSLMIAAVVMFAAVLAIGAARDMPLGEVVMVGISQLVGMIPEGLPVAMTVALAVGVQRMARRRAVVRRLSAVETLGATSVICTDKTGTLTRNEMTVTAIALPDGRALAVTGAGYEPAGDFLDGGRAVAGRRVAAALPAELCALLEAGVLCNDADLRGPEEDDDEEDEEAAAAEEGAGAAGAAAGGAECAEAAGGARARWRPVGDPTEVALVVLAMKGGLVPAEVRRRLPRRAELPFDPAAKLMATQHDGPGGPLVIVKGAPEVMLELCGAARRYGGDGGGGGDAAGPRDVPLDDAARRALRDAADRMAAQALRVLAIGVIEGDGAELDGRTGFAALRGRVTLLGLLGQIDPPRPEVADAVARCRAAGIRPVMVTGDHVATAHAIARELGIARDGAAAIDGRELERMSAAELAERIDGIAVFARVHPAQKLRIVDAYQRRREVVAMTGDGVNDAPALVQADVGVAMGVTGTEVAKEAAKIVVSDDNFATIVAAVEEGRIVYRNIKKAVLLLFSTSAAEVIVLLGAMLLGYPPPFAAVQILWNNLVSEGLITINLIMEPAEGDEMRRPPISQGEPLLTRVLLTRMALMVPTIVAVTLGWFIARLAAGVPPAQVQTETFTLLVLCEWFNVLNCRSETRSALTSGLLKNPWLVGGLLVGNALHAAVVFWEPLGRVFHTVPLGATEVLALAALGSAVLWVEELRKLVVRRRERRRAPAAAAGAASEATAA